MACKLVLPSNEIIKLPSLPQSFEELLIAIRNRLEVNFSENCLLKYMDVDKELINLTNDEDFQTAKLSNEAEQVKTLKVFILLQEDPYKTPVNNRLSTLSAAKNAKSFGDMVKANTRSEDLLRSYPNRVKITPFQNTSELPEGDNIQLSNDQLGIIDQFLELKIKTAVEENIKAFLPKLVTELRGGEVDKASLVNSMEIPAQKANGPQSCPIVRSKTLTFRKYSSADTNKCEFLCNECEKQIIGIKYVCLECPGFKCCEQCEEKIHHSHPLLKVRVSSQNKQILSNVYSGQQSNYNMLISPEKSSKECPSSSVLRQLLPRNSNEKKPQYSGKIQAQNFEETPISTITGQKYIVVINIKNTGIESWPKDVRLCCVNGVHRNVEEKVLPLEAKANQTMRLSLEAPSNTGKYLSQWRLYYNDGEKPKSFGESLFIEIQVENDRSAETKDQGRSILAIKEIEDESNQRKMRSMDQSPIALKSKRSIQTSSSYSTKKQKIASYLNDIFPGDLDGKIDFLNKLTNVEDQAIEKIVESYLHTLSRVRMNKSYPNKEVLTAPRHELSVTM